jgi:hypothetical protein
MATRAAGLGHLSWSIRWAMPLLGTQPLTLLLLKPPTMATLLLHRSNHRRRREPY